jgi:hypothetical protein
MPDEFNPAADNNRYGLPTDGLFNLPSGRELQQRVSQEATQLWRDAREQFSPRNVGAELLQTYGTLPATRITSEESPTNITLEGSLRARTGKVDGVSNSGTFSFELRSREQPANPFSVPRLGEFSYDFNAQSANDRYRLHIWADQANHPPNIDLSARMSENLSLTYVRNQQQHSAAIQGMFRQTEFAGAHNFRNGETTFSASRRVEDGLQLGLQFDHNPHGNRYNFGLELRLGAKPPRYYPDQPYGSPFYPTR